jgi:hypothetical protein
MVPFPADALPFNIIVAESAPETIDHPAGIVHVYFEAIATLSMVYVKLVELKQTVVGPTIIPGVLGTDEDEVTAIVLVASAPQDWEGVTVILPLLPFGVTVIVFVEDLPIQPEGNVHV